MKEQVNSLKTIIDALNENKFITNYTEAADGSCTITFNDGKTITLHNGKDGAAAPAIGIAQFEGIYYWTLGGDDQWLLDDNQNKIPVAGPGPGHPDHPARRTDLVPRPAEPLRTLHAAATAGTRPPQVHPLLDARTGHRPFALRLDRPDRPTRAALPSDPGYGVQRLHRTAVQQFVRHLRHGERHDQSPQVTDSL